MSTFINTLEIGREHLLRIYTLLEMVKVETVWDLWAVVNMVMNFMVIPCISNIQHFNNQLTHTMLKNGELLNHFIISKTAPTCFGLQGNHHQGATIST